MQSFVKINPSGRSVPSPLTFINEHESCVILIVRRCCSSIQLDKLPVYRHKKLQYIDLQTLNQAALMYFYSIKTYVGFFIYLFIYLAKIFFENYWTDLQKWSYAKLSQFSLKEQLL